MYKQYNNIKLLIISEDFHNKNKEGFESICNFLGIKYSYGSINDIYQYNIIYSPRFPIDTSLYPSKIFIFGPHFSVFPDLQQLQQINNINNNAIYIQPSIWAVNCWKYYYAPNIPDNLPIVSFPFPIDTNKYIPNNNDNNNDNKQLVLIYFKLRQSNELEEILKFCSNQNLQYKLFSYTSRYDENDFIKCVKEAKYAIIIDRHESQGFALQEMMSCNLPLLVWNVKSMNQEVGLNYDDISATSVPYWDCKC